MFITKVKIRNFRCLKDIILDLDNVKKQDLALLIGRNNSGKTSFITLFERFYEKKPISFYDFPLEHHAKLLKFDKNSDVNEFLIQLIFEIKYADDDSLENISDFILDLDPQIDTVKILFEYKINKDKLNIALEKIADKHKEKFIQKNISHYIDSRIYSFADDEDIKPENKDIKAVVKSIDDIKKLINIQIIHAKRNVASSETEYKGKGPLSALTTAFYNQQNAKDDVLNQVNESIYDMDLKLKENYTSFFSEFLEQAQKFLNLKNLSVVSDLESKEIIANYSKIVYGDSDSYLPENLNGLGHLNILYLLLQIEIKKKLFETSPKDINLLFIEEPEAHTHPQMQYVFMKEIKQVIAKIPKLQTFISTHSSHIVSLCNFEDIRYFKYSGSNNIEIKNFYHEMQKKYKDEEAYFKFLKQYLTLYSSELFFADKIIFIEGVTERILLPLFIDQFDKKKRKDPNYNAIRNQNISIVEVGNNAKVFEHFLEFLDIKTLIITDIDTTKGSKDNKCSVNEAENIRNSTLKYYFKAPKRPALSERESTEGLVAEKKFRQWLINLIDHKHNPYAENIKLAYQGNEHSITYQARTFEDAFIAVNLDKIKENINELQGLIKQAEKELNTPTDDYFTLAEKIIDSKSDFASSLLYIALTKNIEWAIPQYIETGLEWVQK